MMKSFIVAAFFCFVAADALRLYGIEPDCKGILCPNLQFEFVRYVDFVKENLFPIGPIDTNANILAYQRFHAYDNTTKTYYFANLRAPNSASPSPGYPPLITLYVISYGAKMGVLSNTTVDSSVYQNLTTLHYDPQTKTLFGVYQNLLVAINPNNGSTTLYAQMWDPDTDYYYNRMSAFDPATGRIFISIHDYQKNSYHIATYAIHERNLTVSPPVGFDKFNLAQNLVEGIAYNPLDGGVLLLAESRMGMSFERFEPSDGSWKTIMPYNDPEIEDYDAYDYASMYGPTYAFDPVSNRFIVTVDDDPEDDDSTCTIQYDPTQNQVYGINDSSIDFTNYIVDYDA